MVTTIGAGLCAIAALCAAEAQQVPRAAKIGVITIGVPPASPHIEAFRQGMREHGYIEGKNFVLEYRHAEGQAGRLPAMAAELVRLNVNVIVTESTPAALAARKATTNIPIVMALGTDPVRAGLATSLARPGGNATGLTLAGAHRTAKQLQLLKESMPSIAIVALIHNAARLGIEEELKEAADIGRTLGLAIQLVPVRSPNDLNAAFDAIAKARPNALVTIGDGMLHALRATTGTLEGAVNARCGATLIHEAECPNSIA